LALPRSLPNQITIARLVLALGLFVILQLVGWAQHAAGPLGETPAGPLLDFAHDVLGRERLLLNLGTAIFAVAAISDILDGQIARRWNLTTDFGRIADPFADKVIVIGAFLFLVPIAGSGVSAWMVVVIVARESLVDGLRGFAESRGVPFPASFWGKAKMVAQCLCIGTILLMLANAPDDPKARAISTALLALTVFVTLFSGAVYLVRARKLLSRGASGEAIAAAPATPDDRGTRLEAQGAR
jgi:CDP-diacylglycerol--glycerol-3-phosphate 3-phosphatidyltransferase